MGKVTFKPGTMLNPVPVVMVSCGTEKEEQNIITIAWTGIMNTEPPMVYISVRKGRHSHPIIMKNQEFVINLVTEKLATAADFCGVRSGRDVNKFEEQHLTPIPAEKVKCPMIEESPMNLECVVKEVKSYGSHDVFISEIVAVHADESLMDATGRFELDRARLVCYSHGEYFGLKREAIGKFGFSVMKEKTRKRLNREKMEKKGGRSTHPQKPQ